MPGSPPEESLRATLDALGLLRDRASSVASEVLGTLPVTGEDGLQSALDAWTDEVAALARLLSQVTGAEVARLEAATGLQGPRSLPQEDVLPMHRPWSPPLPRAPR